VRRSPRIVTGLEDDGYRVTPAYSGQRGEFTLLFGAIGTMIMARQETIGVVADLVTILFAGHGQPLLLEAERMPSIWERRVSMKPILVLMSMRICRCTGCVMCSMRRCEPDGSCSCSLVVSLVRWDARLLITTWRRYGNG
jgi:hypothetical protein